MEEFTLDEAKRWVGRKVIAKTAFEADHTQIEAEEQGTVTGVDEQCNPEGEPNIRLTVEFRPHSAAPIVILVPKWKFNEYLCLSHTVESHRA